MDGSVVTTLTAAFEESKLDVWAGWAVLVGWENPESRHSYYNLHEMKPSFPGILLGDFHEWLTFGNEEACQIWT